MVTWRFFAVTVAGLAYFTGWTLLYPVLPRFVEDELGGSGAAVGLAVGSFGITAALLRPIAGRLGDRRGRRLLVVGGMSIVAVSLLGLLFVDSILEVVILRMIFGAGEAFAFVGLATAVQDMAPDHRRGEAANYFSFAVYGGVGLGPPIGEWLFDGSHYERVWLVAAVLVIIGALLGLLTPVGDHTGQKSTQSGWIHPEALLPGLSLLGAMIGYAGFVTFVAVYADSIGVANAGLVFTIYAVLIITARLFFAKVPDRFGARRVAGLSLAAIGTGLITAGVVSNPVGLYTGVVIFSAGMSMNFPAMLAFVVNRSDPADRAFVVASLSVFFDIGFAFGAAAIGVVVGIAGEGAAFIVGGLCAILGLIPLRMSARNDTPATVSVSGAPT